MKSIKTFEEYLEEIKIHPISIERPEALNDKFTREVIKSLERIKKLINDNLWFQAKKELEILVKVIEEIF